MATDSSDYEVALSTSDNPYSPISEFDQWDSYDRNMGYNTSAYLARVTKTSTEYGDATHAEDIEKAIDEAVLFNLISWFYDGISYIKVVEKVS